ncbi:MAG TPA: hypothetical protein VMT16_10715, partial [Thermoanaerobaculia bacterium]|nr:hypothetical protein [Thermoanaerobaculia bacterium]
MRNRLFGIVRLEWRRQLLGFRVVWLLALAALPVALTVGMVLVHMKLAPEGELRGQVPREELANLYHGLMVRVVLFFGSLALFMGLVRGEVEQRSLHYYFLSPTPRWVVVVGKYLAALALGWALFVPATVLSMAAAYYPGGLGRLLRPPGSSELLAYVGMTMLGCAAYGALFLAVGTLLRGPGYVVALLFLWEWLHFLLPPLLKQLSVVHYLRALTPVPISEGPFALLADPKPVPLVVLQLLL